MNAKNERRWDPAKRAGVKHATVIAHDVRRDGGMENVTRETVIALLDGGWQVRLYAKTCDLAGDFRGAFDFRRIRTPRRPFVLSYPIFGLAVGVRLLIDRADSLVFSVGANIPNKVDVVTVHYCHAANPGTSLRRFAGQGALRRLNSDVGRLMARVGERWCYRPARVRAMTAVSPQLRSELLRSFRLDETRIEVIPNGVDVKHFSPDPLLRERMRELLRIDSGSLVAVFVGGDWQRKGLDIAMQAAAKSGWDLIVVGRGDQDLWQRTAAGLGLRVIFVGHVPDSHPYYVASDAFLLPSRYEGFALVTLEAAASGLPMLVTAACGATELVNQAGLQVLPRSAVAFEGALQRLSACPDERFALSQSARVAALSYSWDAIRAQYRQFLEDVETRSTVEADR